MNNNLANPFNRATVKEEQILYNHLLEKVEIEEPPQMIERLNLLFIEGSGYADLEVSKALNKLVVSKLETQDFNYILNRCCCILINRWHTSPERKTAINKLIQLFDESILKVRKVYSYSRNVRELGDLVCEFTKSEQYLALKRFAEVINQPAELDYKTQSSEPLRILIPRYPYLYKHCLLSEDSSYEHQQMIQLIQVQKQRKYELDLSQYVAHQMRLANIARRTSIEEARKIVSPVPNPTFLNNRELFAALKQFVGKIEGTQTYKDLAQSFLSQTKTNQSFREFKNSLYEYISPTSIDSSYIRNQFNDKLYKQLQNTIPHSDEENFSEFLLLRTCNQILNFLVVESPQKPNHFVFIDLIANVGPTMTVGLLLKIVLICRKVKPYLEKRFAILFNHYESCSQDGVLWLVKVLENLNIALSTNFGGVDLSFIR
ncbi:hypothetical protein PA905_38140 [Planktothrix agardhii CCAP 1459/11A]|uniref:Uncharacterized protein n=1 Tax=Planktothrix agardhii CCAP 1459/11A TaxID=282420 RepID=A0A479ZQK9_PLAAG|nr:hypothetical protein [Planktothrix agardhii]GCL34765.1 hypothetical protein PA905_38140 [Planktothrix agardhii CCAP 1459/11A]